MVESRFNRNTRYPFPKAKTWKEAVEDGTFHPPKCGGIRYDPLLKAVEGLPEGKREFKEKLKKVILSEYLDDFLTSLGYETPRDLKR